jgi:hypothetical protein
MKIREACYDKLNIHFAASRLSSLFINAPASERGMKKLNWRNDKWH